VAVVEGESNMIVLFERAVFFAIEQSPAHAKMQNKMRAIFHFTQKIFRAPAQRAHLLAGDPAAQLASVNRLAEARFMNMDLANGFPTSTRSSPRRMVSTSGSSGITEVGVLEYWSHGL
jgi:hypothetical protein